MSIEMSRNYNDLIHHKNHALNILGLYMDSLLAGATVEQAKADKLAYWLEDWTRFLSFENHFNSRSLKRYKRGEIIKVHLGFNVGSEEGGLHYAVVIDNNNRISDPTVRIVPLTSVKPRRDTSDLPEGCIFLGNELFTSMSAKFSTLQRSITKTMNELSGLMNIEDMSSTADESVAKRMAELQREQALLQRMTPEISKMKQGSIALVKQITTISKIRIYDPKTNNDILSHIKLSNEKLDLIDQEIIRQYTKKKDF